MLDKSLAIKYANALHSAAIAGNAVKLVQAELASLSSIIMGNGGLRSILIHPVISAQEKIDLFRSAFGGKASPLVLQFIETLLEKKRINYLELISQVFETLANVQDNKIKATITLAAATNPAMQKKMAETLTKLLKKEVDLTVETDESIIGGAKLRIADKVIDGTIAYQMHKLEEKIVYG